MRAKPKRAWEDITDVFTRKGIDALLAGEQVFLSADGKSDEVKVGAVLKFRTPLSGKITNLRVTRIDKHTGKVWAKHTELITTEQAEEFERSTHARAIRRLRRKGNKLQ